MTTISQKVYNFSNINDTFHRLLTWQLTCHMFIWQSRWQVKLHYVLLQNLYEWTKKNQSKVTNNDGPIQRIWFLLDARRSCKTRDMGPMCRVMCPSASYVSRYQNIPLRDRSNRQTRNLHENLRSDTMAGWRRTRATRTGVRRAMLSRQSSAWQGFNKIRPFWKQHSEMYYLQRGSLSGVGKM